MIDDQVSIIENSSGTQENLKNLEQEWEEQQSPTWLIGKGGEHAKWVLLANHNKIFPFTLSNYTISDPYIILLFF